MSTIDTARILAETDPRVGGTIIVCECGRLVAVTHNSGIRLRNLDTGYPHACPTVTSVYRVTVTHSAETPADVVASLIARAIDSYGADDIDSADVTCCVCGETGGGCCEFGADPDRAKAVAS